MWRAREHAQCHVKAVIGHRVRCCPACVCFVGSSNSTDCRRRMTTIFENSEKTLGQQVYMWTYTWEYNVHRIRDYVHYVMGHMPTDWLRMRVQAEWERDAIGAQQNASDNHMWALNFMSCTPKMTQCPMSVWFRRLPSSSILIYLISCMMDAQTLDCTHSDECQWVRSFLRPTDSRSGWEPRCYSNPVTDSIICPTNQRRRPMTANDSRPPHNMRTYEHGPRVQT